MASELPTSDMRLAIPPLPKGKKCAGTVKKKKKELII
jgi:hypothetical protein